MSVVTVGSSPAGRVLVPAVKALYGQRKCSVSIDRALSYTGLSMYCHCCNSQDAVSVGTHNALSVSELIVYCLGLDVQCASY